MRDGGRPLSVVKALGTGADAAERLTSPKENAEGYEIRINEGFQPEISKKSSEEVALGHAASAKAAGFAVLFVCGVSCVSVTLAFVKISGMEPGKLLRSM